MVSIGLDSRKVKTLSLLENLQASMKWMLMVLIGLISLNAQAQFRLVQGKVYSLYDPAWTVFNCHLEVIEVNGEKTICRPFRLISSSKTTQIHAANPRVSVEVTTFKEYLGTSIIILNDKSAFVGQEFSPPIRAMKVSIVSGVSPARTGGIIDEPIYSYPLTTIAYDLGVNYVPPPKKLTPEEEKIREQNAADLKAKAFQFMQLEASNGVASAQYRYGMAYLKGEGIGSNRYLAIDWLGKAALQGNENAKTQLGLLQKPSSKTNSISN